MSTENIAKKTSKDRAKTIDLSKATVANGALESKQSIYDIMGISSRAYWTADYETYKADIDAMALHKLHEHAYDVGVAAMGDRTHLIDQLERKFILEHGRQGRSREVAQKTQAQTMREQALRALSHGA